MGTTLVEKNVNNCVRTSFPFCKQSHQFDSQNFKNIASFETAPKIDYFCTNNSHELTSTNFNINLTNCRSKLKGGLINIRSIRNKKDEISLVLDSENFDLLLITETWLRPDETLDFLNIHILEKYNYIVINRSKKIGGGCAALIKKEVPFLLKSKCSKFNSEILHFQLSNSKLLNYILVYRPPDTTISQTKKLFKYLETLSTYNCVFIGDFNFGTKDINLINITPYPKSNFGELFIDFFNRNSLFSITPGPTRNQAWLDLCLTNKPEIFSNVICKGSLFSSDHETIIFDFHFPEIKKEKNLIKYRKYILPQIKLLNIYLSSNITNLLISNFHLEDKYNCLITNIIKAFDIFIPENIITKNDKVYKYPPHLKASIKEKAKLNRLCKINENYKDLYKSITLHIKIQTRNFFASEQNKIFQKNPNNIFKYINKHKTVNNIIPSIVYQNTLINKSEDKVDIFSSLFKKNFSNNTRSINLDFLENESDTQTKLTNIEFNIIDVVETIKKLPNKAGTSPDGINYKMLKSSINVISPHILELFRISLDSGKIPSIWKKSIIIPLFKKGEKSNPENYRPISLTCCTCRVMEKILTKYIVHFLTVNNLLSQEQFGFIKNRSTTTQFISTLEDWHDAIFKKKNIDCIFIDFQKAFDSVPHDLLLKKLFKIGIQGKLIRWIYNFLTNRTFQVNIGQNYSKSNNITSGVPQGSVLGPLLFLIYINDLPTVIPKNVHIKLFADDVKIYNVYNTKAERQQLKLALKNIEEWSRRWKINIATNKTFIIHIGKNNPKDQYKINDNIICEVQSIRDLGIIIDNKLKFTEHISKIVRNTYMRMNLLFKIIKSKSTKTWLTLYKSYIRPLLEYAPEAWNPLQISEIKKLEKCQKYFTKIMLKKCRLPNIPYENRLEYLKIPTLETRRKIFDLVLMYKIINGYTHLNTESFFTKNQKRTRFSQYKIKSKFQNFNSSKSFINRTTKMWNVLDNETLKANSPYNFKNKLKLVLVQ